MNKPWTLPTNEEFLREFAPELLEFQGGVAVDPQDGGGAQPTIFNFVLDVSGSMSPYYQTLVDSFNQIMVPGLRGVRMESNDTMLIGGVLFSNKLIPLWPGFKSIKSLGVNALRLQQLNADGLRDQTALYRAMVAGLVWTNRAMAKFKQENPFTSSGIKGKVCILTDGANNREPLDAAVVRKALEEFTTNSRGKRNIQCTLAFLKTDQGLTESTAKQVALATGFEFSGFYDLTTAGVDENGKPQTPQQMFRHAFKLWSDLQGQTN